MPPEKQKENPLYNFPSLQTQTGHFEREWCIILSMKPKYNFPRKSFDQINVQAKRYEKTQN